MTWLWVILSNIVGVAEGIIVMAILAGSWDKAEERGKEKNRRRCNADGSVKGESRE